MRQYVPKVLLWLFVINLGIALGAVAVIVVERIATFAYFIPTMVWLQGAEGLPEAEVQAALSQWLLLDYGRHVLTLAGWLAALKAFSLPSKRGG